MAIKKNPTTSIKKHVNELKVLEKPVKTLMKQDLSLDFNFLNNTTWDVLENKTNATSYTNIGSLMSATEEKWNKISKEFILKACKSFWKNGGHIE